MSPWVLPIAVSARIRACSTPAALAVILVALISTPAFAQLADAASAA
jgi:hypothetical protein